MLGSVISDSIYRAVADITFGVIDRITEDLASEDKSEISDSIVSAILDLLISAENEMSEDQKKLLNQLISDAVDLIISRVQEKKWKLAEQEKRSQLKEVFS